MIHLKNFGKPTRNYTRYMLAVAVIMFGSISVKAQVFDEWTARPNVGIQYKFNKKLDAGATYYLYLDDFSKYKKSVLAGEVNYKLTKWLKAGLEYRFGSGGQEQYHDLRYALTFDVKPATGWKIKYRPMLQQEFVGLDEKTLDLHPVEYFLRNRLTLEYKLSDMVEMYVFSENYLKLKEDEIRFNRQKSALGADFRTGARSTFGARFEVLNKRNGKLVARPNLSYRYTLGYVKQK